VARLLGDLGGLGTPLLSWAEAPAWRKSYGRFASGEAFSSRLQDGQYLSSRPDATSRCGDGEGDDDALDAL
jgi:hypothetical protein